ncbi:glycosyltransferase family 39 protein [Candidatus Curtissbacteria bacterium]|nr:glycosyltransferase family 39 protein [Candidatus Curtissbacteria bacterium]
MSKSKARSAILFLASFIYLLVGIKQFASVYDEGLVVYGAKKVLDGQIPYRDFWSLYPPGQFYTLADLFKIFGTNLFTERIFGTIVQSLVALTVFLLVQKTTNRTIAVTASIVVLIMTVLIRNYGSVSAQVSLLFMLISCYLLSKFEKSEKKLLFLAGFSCGLSTLFRIDIGALAFFAFILFIAISQIQITKKLSLSLAKKVFALTVGFLVPICFSLTLLLRYVNSKDLLQQLLIFPATIYPKVRHLPIFNNDSQFALYLIILVYFLSLFMLRNKKSSLTTNQKRHLLLFVLVGSAFLIKGLSRLDPGHLFPTIITAILSFSILYSQLTNHINLEYKPVRYLVRSLIVPLLMTIPIITIFLLSSFPALSCNNNLPESGCINVESEQLQAIQFIKQKTTSQDYIFVGNSRHDQLFANDVIFYFLAGRNSPTKYHELHPGLANTAAVQSEIIKSLQEKKVKYVVLYAGFENSYEQNGSAQSSHVAILDDYLIANYKQTAQFGMYRILQNETLE